LKGSENRHIPLARRQLLPVVFLLLTSFVVGGCGRVLQPPTPTAMAGLPATATDTPWPTATRRATFTPVPATPSDTPTPTMTPTPVIYVIQKGDTLLPIARRFGVTVAEIQEANGISDPRRLSIGQEIIIPVKEGDGQPTVVPTPTPVALQIRGLAFHYTPTESLWCLGEVMNLSGQPAEEVQVEVSLHDQDGQLLAAERAFTQLEILAAGGQAPFAILFTAPPSSFAQYQTRVLGGVPSTYLGPRYPDLEVLDVAAGWLDEPGAGNYQVRGEVHNAGQADAENVVVVVTLYDEEGHVVAARTADIPPRLFLAGARAPFEVTMTPLGAVDRYEVQVQGWWVGYEAPLATGTPTPTPIP
jgi:LysM repeat protein